MNLLFFGGFGFGEIAVIVILFVALFGGSKAPEIAKSLGKGVKEFKRLMVDLQRVDDKDDK
jgi:sec-independent protein translocase protein TatA